MGFHTLGLFLPMRHGEALDDAQEGDVLVVGFRLCNPWSEAGVAMRPSEGGSNDYSASRGRRSGRGRRPVRLLPLLLAAQAAHGSQGFAVHVDETTVGVDPKILQAPTSNIHCAAPFGPNSQIRLLSEPDTRRLSGADVETLRFLTVELGHAWPYFPQEGPMLPPGATWLPGGGNVAWDLTVLVSCAILVPEYTHERVTVELQMPVSVEAAIAVIQGSRDARRADMFPLVLPVQPQPVSGWGLLIALPGWAWLENVVCFDLSGIGGNVFATSVPGTVDRQDLLYFADLPANASVDVYVAEDQSPAVDGQRVTVHQGQLVSFVTRGDDAPALYSFAEMLLTPVVWDEGPAFPIVPGGPSYLIVRSGRHLIVDAQAGRAVSLREEIASAVGVSLAHLVIEPAVPTQFDVTMFGRWCRAVLAIGELAPVISGQPLTLALVDCRPILQGWALLYVHEGVVPHRALLQSIGEFAPPGWELTFRDVEPIDDMLPLSPGQVVLAVYVPQPGQPDVGEYAEDGDDADDSESSSDDHDGDVRGSVVAIPDVDVPEPPSTATDDATGTYGVGWTRRMAALLGGCYVLLRAGMLCAGRLAQCRAPMLVVLVAVWSFGGCIGPVVEAVQILPIQDSPAAVCSGPVLDADLGVRGVPTPCRAMRRNDIGPGHAHDVVRVDAALPVETSRAAPLWEDQLCTLLEHSVQDMAGYPLYQTATLLEVLFEHFSTDATGRSRWSCSADGTARGKDRSTAPLTVRLETAVPLTPFQKQVLEFHAVFPEPVPPSAPEDLCDWLDNDLSHLLSDQMVPRWKRQAFQGIERWHGVASRPLPLCLRVYTDGSAASLQPCAGECLAPGAWAFSVWVCADKEYLLGHAVGLVTDPSSAWHVGEQRDDPLTCELLGLVWALAWIAQYGPALELPVECRYDCVAAGEGIFGVSRAPRDSSSAEISEVAAFAGYLRQWVEARLTITHSHVRAHTGDVANELCDELAKKVRRHASAFDPEVLPVWVGNLFAHPFKAWSWLGQSGTADVPSLFSFEAEAHRLQQKDQEKVVAPSMGFRRPDQVDDCVTYCFRLVTFNALTLLDPNKVPVPVSAEPSPGQPVGMRVMAKRAVLKKQFLEEEVLMIGLQETRLQQTATLPDAHFIMLHAGANERGQYGVALWVNKMIPYAWKGDRKWFLSPQHLTVSAVGPRFMVVQVSAPMLHWTVLVAHAPSGPLAVKGASDRFWQECAAALQGRPRDSELVVLTDANAHLGSLPSGSVGSLDAEEENIPGECFHCFVSEWNLWLLSTFSGCHSGPSASPDGTPHRLDYIAVPERWQGEGITSRIWDTFEALQLRDDHFPALLTASFQGRRPAQTSGTYVRKAMRPTVSQPTAAYVSALAVVPSLPQAAWHVPVDTHYEAVVGAWRSASNCLESADRRDRVQCYLTEPTLQLVEWRKAWRHHVCGIKSQARLRTYAFVFQVWRRWVSGVPFESGEAQRWCAWSGALRPDLAQATFMIRRLGSRIKDAARADRVRYLQGLVSSVTLADLRNPKDLYQRVRRAFPQSRPARKPLFCPVPAVETPQGDLAKDTDGRLECWRAHFAEQEAGEVVSQDGYVQLLKEQRAGHSREAPVFELSCVPDLFAVEQTFLSLPAAKASGYDGLTGELLKLHAPASARAMIAVYAKASIGICEPVEFRGGSLIPLAKKAAAIMACENFRSVLVSSVAGKAYHKQIRQQLVPLLRRVGGDMQAGAMPGVSTEAVAMAARTFRGLMIAKRQAWALTFFDVKAAYYRVLRQALVNVSDSEAAVRRLFHDLGIPPSALEELVCKLESAGAIAQAGASEHLCRTRRGLAAGYVVQNGRWVRSHGHPIEGCVRGTG